MYTRHKTDRHHAPHATRTGRTPSHNPYTVLYDARTGAAAPQRGHTPIVPRRSAPPRACRPGWARTFCPRLAFRNSCSSAFSASVSAIGSDDRGDGGRSLTTRGGDLEGEIWLHLSCMSSSS